MKHLKLYESFTQLDENQCPICAEAMTTQCRCGNTKHNLESLKRGHGKSCKNGHLWSYNTVDGKLISIGK